MQMKLGGQLEVFDDQPENVRLILKKICEGKECLFSEELGAATGIASHEIVATGTPIKQRAYRCCWRRESFVPLVVSGLHL